MSAQQPKRPTDAELDILCVLWRRGPSTVRQVFHDLRRKRRTGYTTVLKFMQIMTEKGLVSRDTTVRPQVYAAALSQTQTQGILLGDILDRVFSGSPGNLVLQALSAKKSTPEERKKIRELLDRLERESR